MLYPPLITVYTKPEDARPACQQCNATKRKLDALTTDGALRRYLSVDVTDPANASAVAMLEARGVRQTPYVIVTQEEGGVGTTELDAWGGFVPDKLVEWAR
ncbi:glutaredoxin [Microbacterium resistens]|uniref:Glutaredoxin n=1 Tax=Microbacterium resistens TaxID=156977 RepID=A0ABU1SGL3_9MICO|nr:glutaredoxin domain-containing protein [Microbacterium resistens]MDR6868751.1 glutaredoxin [Microbacterium resistens]